LKLWGFTAILFNLFANYVLMFSVEFWELSHLTHDLSQAEKKINVVMSLADAQNDIFFTQNGQSYLEIISNFQK
jgi:hypothetical protein